ncbi:MAG TPA: hypothetical protein VEJ68_02890 [Candidatus Bathyarchaeia archaeon]|nr:hypothetical protein [Candidatus Bathyarchaeia archaeon]
MEQDVTYDKNKTVTFRIDTHVLDKIKSHAAFEKITLNALVNQLLAHAVDWDIVAAKSGWVPIPKTLLMAWFDNLDDQTIVNVAREMGKNVSKDLLFAMRGKNEVWEWVSVLRGRAKAAGFSFTQVDDANEVKFIMKHDMGLKWSKHFMTFYEEAFKEMGCNVKFDFTDNTLIYKIDKKYMTHEK